jgi:hypothetical protein
MISRARNPDDGNPGRRKTWKPLPVRPQLVLLEVLGDIEIRLEYWNNDIIFSVINMTH